jgi:hypothetical protein
MKSMTLEKEIYNLTVIVSLIIMLEKKDCFYTLSTIFFTSTNLFLEVSGLILLHFIVLSNLLDSCQISNTYCTERSEVFYSLGGGDLCVCFLCVMLIIKKVDLTYTLA